MSLDNNFKEDRRIFERLAVTIPVDMTDLDAVKESVAQTCDVSAKGVGLITKDCLNPGNRVELLLNIDDGKEPFYTKGCVMWSSEHEAGRYRSGILFDKPELMGLSRIFRS